MNSPISFNDYFNIVDFQSNQKDKYKIYCFGEIHDDYETYLRISQAIRHLYKPGDVVLVEGVYKDKTNENCSEKYKENTGEDPIIKEYILSRYEDLPREIIIKGWDSEEGIGLTEEFLEKFNHNLEKLRSISCNDERLIKIVKAFVFERNKFKYKEFKNYLKKINALAREILSLESKILPKGNVIDKLRNKIVQMSIDSKKSKMLSVKKMHHINLAHILLESYSKLLAETTEAACGPALVIRNESMAQAIRENSQSNLFIISGVLHFVTTRENNVFTEYEVEGRMLLKQELKRHSYNIFVPKNVDVLKARISLNEEKEFSDIKLKSGVETAVLKPHLIPSSQKETTDLLTIHRKIFDILNDGYCQQQCGEPQYPEIESMRRK